MTPIEFDRLRKLQLSIARLPRTSTISRRMAKNKSSGIGQHLKSGRITSEVNLTRQFNTHRTLVYHP